jgi:uncharacterized protein YbbC (DUF1343 family)
VNARFKHATALALACALGAMSVDATAEVLNGIDVLEREAFATLKGARVGLITNHTGRNRSGVSTIDLLAAAPGLRLVALFSPEHGIRGKLEQDSIEDGRDTKTGLPVFSLYGERRAPSSEQLAGLDTLVFDIQDIGCRFYTYISTLRLCMEVAAKHGLRLVVLDRVNPIGGREIEGTVRVDREKFTATHPIAIRHGMTVGELAGMMNEERGINAKLTVVKVDGWRRKMRYDDTGLPWINPSPNIRKLDAALLYPGIGLVEFAISVGRGTDSPFELLGAPFINGPQLAAELGRHPVPGVSIEPATFTPTASVFSGEVCHGLRLKVTDPDRLQPVALGIRIASAMARLYPNELNFEKMNLLLNHSHAWQALKRGASADEIEATWEDEPDHFERRRRPFLLYR